MRRFRIGRAEANDIVLRQPTVSREHAELTKLNRGLFLLRDLGSSYGTSVRVGSDWKLITTEKVEYRTPVRIGEYETTVANLMLDLDPLAVYMDSPATAPWETPAPRLSSDARAQHPETIAVSGPMSAWGVSERDAPPAIPLGSAPVPRGRGMANSGRVMLSLAIGFGAFLAAAGVALFVALAR